jgi:hypothetical protein
MPLPDANEPARPDCDLNLPITPTNFADFLVHSEALSLAEEKSAIDLIAMAGSQAYALHPPVFWCSQSSPLVWDSC